MKESYDQYLESEAKQLLEETRLPNHEELLRDIQSAWPSTGILDLQFCNLFMAESVALLKHSILLYESGYFDCAFYSIRQAVENLNNMLYLANDVDKLDVWKAKGRFPSDYQIKETLKKSNDVYNQIKCLFPDFFKRYEDLLKKSNKYIHKQGIDTFYISQWRLSKEERTELFVSFLSCAIGMLLILFCALEPFALILTDSDLTMYIHFQPMTEPIPINIAEKYISSDFIGKIQSANFYEEMKSEMLENERLNDGTYQLLVDHNFELEKIDQIYQKMHLLDPEQLLMLGILDTNIKIVHFYWQYDIIGYSTSNEIKPMKWSVESNQFDECLKSEQGFKNYEWRESYISYYEVFETYIILQHYEKLSEKELCDIQTIVETFNKRYWESIFSINN